MLNFIFDLDDTLLATWDLFDVAENNFYDELEKLGFDRKAVEHRFIQIDNANVPIYGFMPKRIHISMGETYLFFCKETGLTSNDETKEKLENIGRGIFETVPKLYDGAIDVLDQLKNKGDQLFLWTKGDTNVQERKIREHNLSGYFKEIYILTNKSKDELNSIVIENKLNPDSTWIVGDSIRSEINPALELGLHAIWISNNTWRYEEVQPLKEDFIKIRSLKEIILKYSTLVGKSLVK